LPIDQLLNRAEPLPPALINYWPITPHEISYLYEAQTPEKTENPQSIFVSHFFGRTPSHLRVDIFIGQVGKPYPILFIHFHHHLLNNSTLNPSYLNDPGHFNSCSWWDAFMMSKFDVRRQNRAIFSVAFEVKFDASRLVLISFAKF